MKKQINPNIKAHLLRGAFYLLLLVTVAVIPFALGQRAYTKQRTVATLPTASLATSRREHSATLLSDGKVLVVGGYTGATVLATSELYDPVSGMWTAGVGLLATARREHTATLLADGRVLVTGGFVVSNSLASTEL